MMELFILWCGFVGAWLLFAGPILQAALELDEQDIARDRIYAAKQQVNVTHVSNWWWLLPPIKFILERRQSRRFHDEFFKVLSQEDLESFITFTNKARGWLFVAGGALLIAFKETYELSEKMDWPKWLFWVVVVGLVLVSLSSTVGQMRTTKRLTTGHDNQ